MNLIAMQWAKDLLGHGRNTQLSNEKYNVKVHSIHYHPAQGYNWSPHPLPNAITILRSVRSIPSEVHDWAFIFIPKFAHFDCLFFMLIRETIWVCEDCVIATADHTYCMHAQKDQKFSEKAIYKFSCLLKI